MHCTLHAGCHCRCCLADLVVPPRHSPFVFGCGCLASQAFASCTATQQQWCSLVHSPGLLGGGSYSLSSNFQENLHAGLFHPEAGARWAGLPRLPCVHLFGCCIWGIRRAVHWASLPRSAGRSCIFVHAMLPEPLLRYSCTHRRSVSQRRLVSPASNSNCGERRTVLPHVCRT